MELSEKHFVLLIVLVLVVILVAVWIFNNHYKTQAERDANHYKLVWGIVIGIAASLVIVCVWGCKSDGMEYGAIWDQIKISARNKKEDLSEKYHNARERAAENRNVKRAGGSLEERQAAVSAVKRKQEAATVARKNVRKGISDAGRNAKAEAAKAARTGGDKTETHAEPAATHDTKH
jgi:hypothetical protein